MNCFNKYREELDKNATLQIKLTSAFEAYKKEPTSKNSRTLIQAILNLDTNVEELKKFVD